MAIYKVQGPNGEIIEIEGPENANPNDVIAQAQMLYKPQQTAATPAKEDTVFSSTGLPAKAMGAFETGLGALSGALAVPASAAAGIYGTLTSGKYGTQEGIRAGDKLARQVQERMTYRPTTQAGQDISESAAKVLEASKLPPMMAGPTGIVGLGGAGPQGAFKQGAQRATQMAGNTAMFVPEVAAGALGRGSGVIVKPGDTPKSYQVASQRNQVGDSFVEPREFSKFEQGGLPYGQLPAEVPIGNLTANPIDKAALVATGGSVPNAGRGARAFGERIGETYRNPFYAAADIASLFIPGNPGIPLVTAGKAGMGAVQALADMRLAGKGFTPNLPQILDDYKTGARPMPRPMPGPEGPMPPMQQFSPGPMPAAGAVRPPTPQTMAAAQINPAAAVTPAAQAAVATTAAKVQQPTTAAAPIPEPVAQPVPQAAAPEFVGPVQPPTPTKAQRMAEPHANTDLIKQTLEQKIANNPGLTGFDQDYVIPLKNKPAIEPFLNNQIKTLVAHGPQGTGKSSLADAWLQKNQDGNVTMLSAGELTGAELEKQIMLNRNQPKSLYVIEEADDFTKAGNQALNKNLEALINASHPQTKFLITTNNVNKIPSTLKNAPSAKLDIALTPEEKSAFALNVARKFNVNKTPAEIEAIAQNPAFNNFRSIEAEVSKGYTIKESPTLFSSVSAKQKMPSMPDSVTSLLDELTDNANPYNVVIFNKSAFTAYPELSTQLKNYAPVPIKYDKNSINSTLLRGNPTGGPPWHYIVTEDNVNIFEGLKSGIARGNKKAMPTNIILEDPENLLSAPILDRATVVDKSYFGNPTVTLANAIKNGNAKGIVKTGANAAPIPEPVVFRGKTYNSGAEMRKDLTKQGISAYDIDKLMNNYFPGE